MIMRSFGFLQTTFDFKYDRARVVLPSYVYWLALLRSIRNTFAAKVSIKIPSRERCGLNSEQC